MIQSVCVFSKAFLGDAVWRESPFVWVLTLGIISPILATCIISMDIQNSQQKILHVVVSAIIVFLNIAISFIAGWSLNHFNR